MFDSLISLDLEVKPDWTAFMRLPYRQYMGTEDPTRKDFGLRLKAAREMRGMTQQFVADLFEVGKGTVSAWETGGGDPGVYRLRRLAKLYDVTADSLLWDETPSRDAMKIAVQFDAFNPAKQEKFMAMWTTHFVEAATDGEVEQGFKEKSAGRYRAPDPIVDRPAAKTASKGTPSRKMAK